MTNERGADEPRRTIEREPPTHLGPDRLPVALRDDVFAIMHKYSLLSRALDYPVAFDVETNGEIHFDVHEVAAVRYLDWLLDTIGPSGLWHVDTDALKQRYHDMKAPGGWLHPAELMIRVGEVFTGSARQPREVRVFLTLTELMSRLVPSFGLFWKSWGQNGTDITAPEAAPMILGAKGNLVVLGRPRSRPA